MCRGPREILEHVHWLIEDGERLGLPVVRVKNKFAMENSSEYDGYRDVMLCVLFTGATGLRIICEIQIHDVRLYQLKLQVRTPAIPQVCLVACRSSPPVFRAIGAAGALVLSLARRDREFCLFLIAVALPFFWGRCTSFTK